MQNLNGRSGRLQMFARLKAENVASAKQNTSQNPPAPENAHEVPPQPTTSVAERQELADNARVPIPRVFRHNAGHHRGSSQPPMEANTRTHTQSPMNHRHGELFSGSQLGEDFMHSGLTTPQNELADPEPEKQPTPERRTNSVVPRVAPRSNLDGGFRPSGNATFHVGDDLLMKVVSGGRRHDPSHMNDGFNNGAVGYYKPDYMRPGSPAEKHPKLPMREVKIRSLHHPRQMGFDNREKRSSSPAYETKGWQTRPRGDDFRQTRFQGIDDDDGTSTIGGGDDRPRTPKLRGGEPSPQKSTIENRVVPVVSVPSRSSSNKDKKRRRESPDYDDMTLVTMTYTELQEEPFDFDPSKATAHIGHGGAGNITTRLEQYRQQNENEQGHMFRNMTVDDWETTGDWFADQFADIMQRLREARRNKRRIIRSFEDEAAAREEAVRLRSDAIDRKLVKMKQDGQRVVHPHDV